MKKQIIILFWATTVTVTYAQSVVITPGATYTNVPQPPAQQNTYNAGMFLHTAETSLRGQVENFNKGPGKKFIFVPSTCTFLAGQYAGLTGSNFPNKPVTFSYGVDAFAYAEHSVAFGVATKTQSPLSFVTGIWNFAAGGQGGTGVATDQLFVVGNGNAETARSNALVLLFNGTLGVNMNAPDPNGAKLQVNGDVDCFDILAADVYGDNAIFNQYWLYNSSPLAKTFLASYPELTIHKDKKGKEYIDFMEVLQRQMIEISTLKTEVKKIMISK